MKNVTRRSFVVAASATTLAALAGCSSSGSSSSSTSASSSKTVDNDLVTMTWDDILAEAKGQKVTFLAWGAGGADAYVQMCWEQLTKDVKEKFDIELECVEYSTAEYQKLTTDTENGGEPTYDMFWFTGSTIAPIRNIDGLFGNQWVKSLPNNEYLDYDNPYITFDGTADTDAMEAPFQGCNPSLVYSQDLWSADIAWNETNGSVKGLPHNFTELASWVKENPGKFSYMDLTGQGSFHGLLFAKAILSELTDDGNGGWKTVYDEADDKATRRKKIQAHIDEWYKWSNSSEATEEAFAQKAAYVWAYLNELAPNLLQGDSGALYIATAPEMMQYVKAGDLACSFTTCTSVSTRVEASPDSYMSNPAIYMLDTSVGYWDYNVITKNSPAKAAVMVICNYMIDPDFQCYAFDTTGNGYNISVDKLPSDKKKALEETIQKMGKLSPSTDEIENNSYVDKYGKITAWLASSWNTNVNNA